MRASLLFAISSFFIFYSCSNTLEDCNCDDNINYSAVIVVDSNGNPVESLTTYSVDYFGDIFRSKILTTQPGAYVVMDDSYAYNLDPVPSTVTFYAAKGNQEVEGTFIFNTDACKCKVFKISGPDTLILR
jgi:hypothetical protein